MTTILALALLLAAPPAAADGSVLAAYDFEDDTTLATGPDTFSIFQHAKGSVALSDAFHLSGYRSLELRDAAGDGGMPEMQGYFPLRRTGRLYAHFAFLTATPREEWNVALAGPAWFRLQKDGIAFWLQARDGQLVHFSDSIPRRLFELEPFVWYVADLDYDVAAGSYDLTIRREGGGDPLVALRGQKGAAAQAGSGIDKFSFVGQPFGDESNVVWYVDDIVLGVDQAVKQHPFAAPGRRRLFVDRFLDYDRKTWTRSRCLPVTDLADFGITPALHAANGTLLTQALGGTVLKPTGTPQVDTIVAWRQGCSALVAKQPAAALRHFDHAAALWPEARLVALSAVMALTDLRRFDDAESRLQAVRGRWVDDVRYAVVAARLGGARGDLVAAEQWLRASADDAASYGQPSPSQLLASEQYYLVLLWDRRFADARDYALRVAARLAALGVSASEWHERAGDAALSLRDTGEARRHYDAAVASRANARSALLKLADVAFLEGHLAEERALRERYYGTLQAR